MLKSIKLIVGLPGSGKTTWGNGFIQLHPNTLFIDDISIVAENAKEYLETIDKNYEYILISDVYFCQEEVRNEAVKVVEEVFPNILVDLVYFENSIDKCLENVSKRQQKGDSRKVFGLMNELSKKYHIPKDVKELLVYQKKD